MNKTILGCFTVLLVLGLLFEVLSIVIILNTPLACIDTSNYILSMQMQLEVVPIIQTIQT